MKKLGSRTTKFLHIILVFLVLLWITPWIFEAMGFSAVPFITKLGTYNLNVVLRTITILLLAFLLFPRIKLKETHFNKAQETRFRQISVLVVSTAILLLIGLLFQLFLG